MAVVTYCHLLSYRLHGRSHITFCTLNSSNTALVVGRTFSILTFSLLSSSLIPLSRSTRLEFLCRCNFKLSVLVGSTSYCAHTLYYYTNRALASLSFERPDF